MKCSMKTTRYDWLERIHYVAIKHLPNLKSDQFLKLLYILFYVVFKLPGFILMVTPQKSAIWMMASFHYYVQNPFHFSFHV